MNRILYWLLKYLVLVAALAGGLWLAQWLSEHLTTIRRGFYSICMVAIFFYLARFVRALALTQERKARKEKS